MTVQVLVSAMNAKPMELMKQMNIESDCITINQCDEYKYEEMSFADKKLHFFSMAERGVGRSRNNALLRADHDISLISDEDIVYDSGYEKKIKEAFVKYPKADILLFNVKVSKERRTYFIEKFGRVRWFNCGRYPAYSIAVKTDEIRKKNINFSLLFGGGAPFSAGEDSLFLRECLRKGLRIYKVPILIGKETPGESTWFEGYTEKFFFDRGVLYHHLYGKLKYLMGLRFVYVKRKEMCKNIPWKSAYHMMKEGMKEAAK